MDPTRPAQGGPWPPMPPVAGVATAPSRSRLFTSALLVATITSVLSTLSFIVYVLVRVFEGAAQQAHLSALYSVGIIGLLVAEGCQILGVVVLIRQWFSRVAALRKPRELLVLLLSLIPYMLVVVFLITLIVYLRARRLDPASQRTQEARQELREQAVDTLIDAGANTTNSAAGAPFAPAVGGQVPLAPSGAPAPVAPASLGPQLNPPLTPRGRANLRDAVRQVIGPSTSEQISQTANGVIAFTMVALLISSVASVGVGIPAKVLAAIHSGSPGSSVFGGSGPASLAGTWTLVLTNCQTCSSGNTETDVMTIQQNGNALTVVITSPNTGASSSSNSLNLTGTVSGQNVAIGGTYSGFGANCTIQLTGTIASANQMNGSTTENCTANGTQQTGNANWTATRTSTSGPTALGTPTASTTGGSSVSDWSLSFISCSTCTSQTTDDMTIQTTGTQLAISLTPHGGSGNTVNLTGSITGSSIVFGGNVSENGSTCTVDFEGTITSSTEMSGSVNSTCPPTPPLPGGAVSWSATLTSASATPTGSPTAGGPTPANLQTFTVSTANGGPHDITKGPDGNLWFAEGSGATGKIARITPDGTITAFSIPSGGGAGGPGMIVTGPDGNLWFTEPTEAKIGRITPTGAIHEFALPNTFIRPTTIAPGSDGNLWFTDPQFDKIGRMTPSGAVKEYLVPSSASDCKPFDITAGPDGNLWYTYSDCPKIGRVSPSGAFKEFTFVPSNPSVADIPYYITAGPDGNLWFTETAGAGALTSDLGRIAPDGTITQFTTPTPGSNPDEITVGPDGNLWFIEFQVNQVARITPDGTITEYSVPVANPSNFTLNGIAGGPDGSIWIAEGPSNIIGKITITP